MRIPLLHNLLQPQHRNPGAQRWNKRYNRRSKVLICLHQRRRQRPFTDIFAPKFHSMVPVTPMRWRFSPRTAPIQKALPGRFMRYASRRVFPAGWRLAEKNTGMLWNWKTSGMASTLLRMCRERRKPIFCAAVKPKLVPPPSAQAIKAAMKAGMSLCKRWDMERIRRWSW